MNLTDNTNNVIEELKKEILLLRKENSDLTVECARLQEVANNALQQNHLRNESSIQGEYPTFYDENELPENENTVVKRSEQILAHERELFEGIINNIPVLITLYDPQLKNFRFNNEMKRVLGWTEDDASDGHFLEKVYPDPVYRKKATEFMQSLKTGWQEYTVTAKDGKQVISSWANILLNSGVQIGIGLDLRDRKKAELKLRENEQRLQGIFNNAAIGIVEMDWNERFILVNDRICYILGYSRSELLNKTVMDITAPEDREHSSFLYQQLHKAETDILNYEKQYIKSDGTSLWVHVSVSAIRDVHGKHLKSIGTIKDISERRQYEKALLDSEERFRMLADNISQMVWIYDKQGFPLWFNKRWIDYTGVDLEEIKRGGHVKVNHPDEVERVMNGFFESVKTGKPWEDTYRMRSKEGEYRWFLSHAMPIFDHEGNIMTWFGTSTDITLQRKTEETLRENEKRLTGMFNNAAIGIAEVDQYDRFIAVNKRICKILDYSPEELLGKSVSEITASEDRPNSDMFNNLLHKGEFDMFNYEKRYLKKDGSPIWVNVSVSAIHDAQGTHIRSIRTVEDISKRKEAESRIQELLRLSDRHTAELIAVIESMPDAVYIGNKNGITQCNTRAFQMFGASSLDDLRQHISEFGQTFNIRWPDTGRTLREEELQFTRALNGETVIEEVVAKNVQTGEDIYIRAANAPVVVNGEIIGAVAINSDITDRKKVEEALRVSEEKFRLLFENITEGVALHEVIYENDIAVNYKILNVNPAFEQNCGLQAEIAVGTLATNLYGTKEPPYLKEYLTVAKTRKPLRFETYFPSLNKHFIINVVSPKEGQFATVFEDITDQKRNEQEIRQKNEELTRFIYTVSHDLKSPLVTIKSFASFLKSDIAVDDKTALDRDIMYIQNAADKMGKLLDELLELSRIGRKEEVKTKVPLREIAQSAIDLVAGRISNGNVEIQFVGPPVMLYGHSQRLIQLYQNLLDNAVKFRGNQQHPLVEIGTAIEGDKVILFVKDNGSGIDPRYHHKIFGLFEKLDNSMEGTGIGLALVKRIVEVHGGNIWFNSEGSEKGTTFFFTLEGSYAI